MLNRSKLNSPRIGLYLIPLFCLLLSCHDDTFDLFNKKENDSPYISFNVVDDATAISRSGDIPYEGYIRNVYPLISEEGGDTLYLIESEYPEIDLGFKSQTASRGELIKNHTGLTDTLGIYGFRTPEEMGKPEKETPLDFNNRKLGLANGSGYLLNEKGEPELWRRYPLDFVAYYPYTKAFEYEAIPSQVTDPEDGSESIIIESNDELDYEEQLYGWLWSPYHDGLCMHPAPRNEMYMYYKVPDSIQHQVDFMASYIQNQSAGTCDIKLSHLLTAIRFTTGNDMYPCTIKKIAISGVRNAGYMDVTKLSQADNGTNEADNAGKQWWEPSEIGEDDNSFVKELKNNSLKRTSYAFDFGKEGLELKEDPKAEQEENRKGKTAAGQSLLGDENQVMFLLPQNLDEKATLYIELEYNGFTIKKVIDLKPKDADRTWAPGVTITYSLSGSVPEMPTAELELIDEYGVPLTEIRVGYAGGETNYKVHSFLNYTDKDGNNFKRLPMPWKASIVTLDETDLDENGNPKETTIISYEFKSTNIGGVDVDNIKEIIKDQAAYDKEFGSVKRIEFDYYGENIPATLDEDDPVKTFVMIPKIVMKKTSSATAYMRGQGEVGSETAPFNLASRGIGLAENGLKIFHKNGMGGWSKPK